MLKNALIADRAIRVWLIKSRPGAEQSVLDELRERADQAAQSGNDECVNVWYAFGDYDIAVVSYFDPKELSPLNRGRIPGILGTCEVVCYGLKSNASDKRFLEVLRENGPFFSISFLRVPGFFLQEEHPHPEQDFFSAWQNSHSERLLMGTFGQPAFVSINAQASLGHLYNKLDRFLAQRADVLGKSFSIIATSGQECSKPSSAAEVGAGPSSPSFSLQIRASTRPEHRDLLCRFAISWFKFENSLPTVVASLPGADDLAIGVQLPREFAPEDLLAHVLEFRKRAGDLLLDTITSFLWHPEIDDMKPDLAPLLAELKLSQEKLKASYIEWGARGLDRTECELMFNRLGDVGPLAVRALHAFADMMENQLLESELVDLDAYFSSLRDYANELCAPSREDEVLPRAKKKKEQPKKQLPDATKLAGLSVRFLPAHMAVDQRTIGSQAGINPVESGVRHLLGGSQRIVQAAEAIPHCVFEDGTRVITPKREPIRWNGIVILGTPREYYGAYHQVISLPQKDMWEPRRWTSLIHESVEALIARNRSAYSIEENAMLNRRFQECERRFQQRCGARLPGFDFKDFSKEVIVDLLHANMGPCWDPDLLKLAFAETCFQNFDAFERTPEPAEAQIRYLEGVSLAGRMLIMWGASQEGLLYKNITQTRKARWWRIVQWVERLRYPFPTNGGTFTNHELEIVRKIGGLLDYLETDGEEILRDLVDVLKPLLWQLATHFVFGKEQLDEREDLWNHRLKDAVEQVRAGIPVQSVEVGPPPLFVYRLLKDCDSSMSAKESSAAILSLLGSYREMMLSWRQKAVEFEPELGVLE